jgi:hypothetical protein
VKEGEIGMGHRGCKAPEVGGQAKVLIEATNRSILNRENFGERTDDLLISNHCCATSVRLRCIVLARYFQRTRLPTFATALQPNQAHSKS